MRLTVKWYVAIWRLLWGIPAYAALLVFCVFIAAGWGMKEAKRAWNMASS